MDMGTCPGELDLLLVERVLATRAWNEVKILTSHPFAPPKDKLKLDARAVSRLIQRERPGVALVNTFKVDIPTIHGIPKGDLTLEGAIDWRKSNCEHLVTSHIMWKNVPTRIPD
jgi:hypothetical protein